MTISLLSTLWNLFAAFASKITLEILHVPSESQFWRAGSLLGRAIIAWGGMKHQKENNLLKTYVEKLSVCMLELCSIQTHQQQDDSLCIQTNEHRLLQRLQLHVHFEAFS